jgi:hypothetical protein
LNRNWVDFSGALPRNEGYDELAEAICPVEWSEGARQKAWKTLAEYGARHGRAVWQHAISGGQYRHPKGIFFGGGAPTWSRLTQTKIFAEYLGRAGKVAIVDFHTGLGPRGLGERIVVEARGSAAFGRAVRWYGNGVASPYDGTSSSAPIVGDGLGASVGLLPHAEVTGMALEFGTVPVEQVLDAVRADAWLHAYGYLGSAEGKRIKEQIRAAFYVDEGDWKGMVVGQALLACRQAVGGLGEGA